MIIVVSPVCCLSPRRWAPCSAARWTLPGSGRDTSTGWSGSCGRHGWQHLAANTVPVLLLGFFALAGGVGQFVAVTATIWLIGGVGAWLTGSDDVHLGASILIFGWLMFLLARSFFARSAAGILLAVALFVFWGGMLRGVLPGAVGISWQGHLFGTLDGLIAAPLGARADQPRIGRSGNAGSIPVNSS